MIDKKIFLQVYLIVQVLVSGILGHMLLTYHDSRKQFVQQRRLSSDLNFYEKKLEKNIFDAQRSTVRM